ncbi:hypothetical protein O3P69_018335 [Scylla paramamosain]|uniref:Uncharacterized protein n=1 Tax=Scylla paramamosain TaxID=85552 RepID=A0AAW0SG91_SCYPA
MALSGPSGRHKRVMSHENNGQVPYKRPRLTTDVGYESQTTLCFRPHSIISTSGKFPGKHILSSVHGGDGLHLSQVGTAHFGCLLDGTMRDCLTKKIIVMSLLAKPGQTS